MAMLLLTDLSQKSAEPSLRVLNLRIFFGGLYRDQNRLAMYVKRMNNNRSNYNELYSSRRKPVVLMEFFSLLAYLKSHNKACRCKSCNLRSIIDVLEPLYCLTFLLLCLCTMFKDFRRWKTITKRARDFLKPRIKTWSVFTGLQRLTSVADLAFLELVSQLQLISTLGISNTYSFKTICAQPRWVVELLLTRF